MTDDHFPSNHRWLLVTRFYSYEGGAEAILQGYARGSRLLHIEHVDDPDKGRFYRLVIAVPDG